MTFPAERSMNNRWRNFRNLFQTMGSFPNPTDCSKGLCFIIKPQQRITVFKLCWIVSPAWLIYFAQNVKFHIIWDIRPMLATNGGAEWFWPFLWMMLQCAILLSSYLGCLPFFIRKCTQKYLICKFTMNNGVTSLHIIWKKSSLFFHNYVYKIFVGFFR